MKKINLIIFIVFAQVLWSCTEKNQVGQQTKMDILDETDGTVVYESEDLIIRKVSANVYQHISYLFNDDLEMVPCNGMIVIHKHKAIIFDTPTNDQNSAELIKWLMSKKGCTIDALVVTNFSKESLGGLRLFHRKNITSFASNQTITLAEKEKSDVPKCGFNKTCIFTLGDKKVYLEHFGDISKEGNVIGYFPDDKVFFGGGLIEAKEKLKMDAVNGYSVRWLEMAAKIKKRYSDSKIVIPGHGETGGPELLDFTKDLLY